MPLVNTKDMFAKAYEGGYSIGAFNVNDMEIVQGIMNAATNLKAPVILQASTGAIKYAGIKKNRRNCHFTRQRSYIFRICVFAVTIPLKKFTLSIFAENNSTMNP